MRTLIAILLLLPASAMADTVTLTAAADAFVSSGQPTSNYGGGGALSVSADGANGEIQTLLRFDAAPAAAAFNTSFGPGGWNIQSATLSLNAASPVAVFVFNPAAAGSFTAVWVANDGWTEGAGSPANPGMTGITFDTLSSITGPTDTPLGVFAFDGGTTGDYVFPLTSAAPFAADIAAGGMVTLLLRAAPAPAAQTVSFVFHSRTFTSPAARPMLTLTATATPPTCAADFNHSSSLTVQDIFDFLNAWFGASPAADFNHVGGLSVQDIFDFLNAWFAGCP